jgi:hypothetical protein
MSSDRGSSSEFSDFSELTLGKSVVGQLYFDHTQHKQTQSYQIKLCVMDSRHLLLGATTVNKDRGLVQIKSLVWFLYIVICYVCNSNSYHG